MAKRGSDFKYQEIEIVCVREQLFPFASKLKKASKVAMIFKRFIGRSDRERLVGAYLNAKMDVIAINTISVGSLTQTTAPILEVFKPAFLCNANCVILGHNHPSGDPKPSPEDIKTARKLKKAAEILGIQLLDFIILGEGDSYTSLAELGKI